MFLKKGWLRKSRLYIIIDKKTLANKSMFSLVKRIKGQGQLIIQLRDKGSNKEGILKSAILIRKSLLNSKVMFIVNDYIDVVKLVDADGVHLGQNDVSVPTARRILGKDKIIGVSCHTLPQAQRAIEARADYISIGPFFFTPTKPEYKPVGLALLKKLRDKIKLPFFAIGGINEENLNQVLAAGAKRVAVLRAVCKAKDPVKAIEKLKSNLENDSVRIC